MGIVYKVSNKINDKCYIGQTVRSLELRKKEHLNQNRSFKTLFQNALYKHGPESFDWEILFETDNIDELNEKEIYYIKKYNTLENGYNLTTGGMNGTYSKESKKKLSKIAKKRIGDKNSFYGKGSRIKGENNHFFGKKHSEETKEKLRQKRLGKKHSEETKRKISKESRGEKNGFYGKKHSEETKRKIRESHLGKKHSEETKQKMRESHRRRKL
jgi:group I intron endonuclease